MADSINIFISNLAESIWVMLVDSAFLLLLGLFLAGFIHLILNEKNLKRLLKGGKNKMVFKAALFGIPIPLCSCSVLPMAHQLRRSGLNKGGTTAFLISTPETGVDSILLTYSLTDPLMTVARPISAFITALTAGLLVNQTADVIIEEENPVKEDCGSCCSSSDNNSDKTVIGKIKKAFGYSIKTILSDLAPYLLIGYVLAGAVAVMFGNDVTTIPEFLRTGWGGYVGAVLVGLPLYICATSSTPLAAALLGAGFSPGAILVFLLVGPATNIATLTVVSSILKKQAVILYLSTIVVLSILCGFALDWIYQALEFTPVYLIGEHDGHAFSLVKEFSAGALAILIVYMTAAKVIKKLK